METLYIDLKNKLNIEKNDILPAIEILRAGGILAFPTETVYGLGGDATNKDSAKKIYEAKGRPGDNPLIVHIDEYERLKEITKTVPECVKELANAFWPGPLTIILKKNEKIPYETTGGLDTVAIRAPSHRAARLLLRESGLFIAAPSANLSGKPSPTTAEHVKADLDTRIDCIIDDGSVDIGLESTILDLTSKIPVILRPGFITKEDLKNVLGEVYTDPGLSGDAPPKAPGMKYRHYAPKGELFVFDGKDEGKIDAEIKRRKEEYERAGKKVHIIEFSEYKTEEEIARNLYSLLRECDKLNADIILSKKPKTDRLSDAVMNRLLKAAGVKECTEVF